MQVVRYFHIRPLYSASHIRRNGATVKVTGDTRDPAQVDVQVVYCSRKDMYCKKTGRSLADVAPTKVVMLRNLPLELSRIQEKLYPVGAFFNTITWMFAMRYFLPKE